MPRIRVAACQIDTVVGDLEGNVERVLEALREVEGLGADVAVFPELTVTGYPPEDLLDRPAFIDDNLVAFERIVAASGACAAVVGFVDRGEDGRLRNAAALCRRGAVEVRYAKQLLPNYGVFDEQRWFTPGTEVATAEVAGVSVGLTICEDMWAAEGPMSQQAAAGDLDLQHHGVDVARQHHVAAAAQHELGRQAEFGVVDDAPHISVAADAHQLAGHGRQAEGVVLAQAGPAFDGPSRGRGQRARWLQTRCGGRHGGHRHGRIFGHIRPLPRSDRTPHHAQL